MAYALDYAMRFTCLNLKLIFLNKYLSDPSNLVNLKAKSKKVHVVYVSCQRLPWFSGYDFPKSTLV